MRGGLVSWYGWAAVILGLILVCAAALVHRSYRRDIGTAYGLLDSLPRRSVETRWGTIEYAVRGEGCPVLVLHGMAGGFDQGLRLAEEHLGEDFTAIAPSRFGYLGTPLAADATPASQADALAGLLDALEVDRTAVVAYSAGGTPGIQLALRHPDRMVALVLLSTAPAGGEGMGLPPKWVVEAVFGSDFAFWTMTEALGSLMRPLIGVPRDYPLSEADQGMVADWMRSILPIKPRASGSVFDMFVSNLDMTVNPEKYPLDKIVAPTLLINAVDDPLAKYEHARAASRRIPDGRLLTVPRGGHVFLGSGELVRREITSFLRNAFSDLEGRRTG
jgi:pimeloyl-ACP methyl ester carboxylesterase